MSLFLLYTISCENSRGISADLRFSVLNEEFKKSGCHTHKFLNCSCNIYKLHTMILYNNTKSSIVNDTALIFYNFNFFLNSTRSRRIDTATNKTVLVPICTRYDGVWVNAAVNVPIENSPAITTPSYRL